MQRREQFAEDRQRLGLPTGVESDSDDEDKRSKRGKKPKGQRGPGQRNGGARNGVCGAKITADKEQLNGGITIKVKSLVA